MKEIQLMSFTDFGGGTIWSPTERAALTAAIKHGDTAFATYIRANIEADGTADQRMGSMKR